MSGPFMDAQAEAVGIAPPLSPSWGAQLVAKILAIKTAAPYCSFDAAQHFEHGHEAGIRAAAAVLEHELTNQSSGEHSTD